MAKFQIQDPTSGKTVIIEGDTAPTQADAEQIFQQAGLRQPSGLDSAFDVAKTFGLGGAVDQAKDYMKNAQGFNPNDPMSYIKAILNPPSQETLSHAPQNAAGAASWMLPYSKAGIVAKTGIGAMGGGLQGLSQDNVNIQSIGTDAALSAVLNNVLPGLGNVLSKGLGKLSLGPGGAALPEINKILGENFKGSGKFFGSDEFYKRTVPALQGVLNDVFGGAMGMTRAEFKNLIDTHFTPENIGSDTRTANKYKAQLMGTFENMMKERFGGAQGAVKTGEAPLQENMVAGNGFTMGDIPGQAQRPYQNMGGRVAPMNQQSGINPSAYLGDNFQIPLDIINNVKKTVYTDAYDVKNAGAAGNVAKAIGGTLKGYVNNQTGGQADKINSLISNANKIYNYQNAGATGRITGALGHGATGVKDIAAGLFKSQLPLDAVLSMAGGQPAGALAAGTGYVLSKPKVSTPIMSWLNSTGFPNQVMHAVNGILNPHPNQ